MPSVPVAGIDMFMIREIAFSLREDPKLADVLVRTVHLLQQSVNLVNKEMVVIYNEIKYWRELSEASPFKKVYTKLLKQGPLHFLITARNLFENEKTFEVEDGLIDLKLSILRDTFNGLAAILGSLNNCGADIRHIMDDHNILTSNGLLSGEGGIYNITSDDSFSAPIIIAPEDSFDFLRCSRLRIARSLRRVLGIFSWPAEAPFAPSPGAVQVETGNWGDPPPLPYIANTTTTAPAAHIRPDASVPHWYPSTAEVLEMHSQAVKVVTEGEVRPVCPFLCPCLCPCLYKAPRAVSIEDSGYIYLLLHLSV